MKRTLLFVFAIALFSLSSCRDESTDEITNTYEQATDKDCVPVAGQKNCDDEDE